MSSPTVNQASLIGDVFASALARYAPRSVAVIGCAGGNGLDRLDPCPVERVVGVDINPKYLDVTLSRYSGRFRKLEVHDFDIAAADTTPFEPVDLTYAALVLEYVEIAPALRNLWAVCRPGGHLITLIQLPSAAVATVTPTASVSVQALGAVMKLVDPEALAVTATGLGFELRDQTSVSSGAGKTFAVHAYKRPSAG